MQLIPSSSCFLVIKLLCGLEASIMMTIGMVKLSLLFTSTFWKDRRLILGRIVYTYQQYLCVIWAEKYLPPRFQAWYPILRLYTLPFCCFSYYMFNICRRMTTYIPKADNDLFLFFGPCCWRFYLIIPVLPWLLVELAEPLDDVIGCHIIF